ncbi:hypothetical protein HYDPIDRAFT_32421 [Hydnomerulius pinastri MD-312]|uniref:Uncharacterized protein n=1 Tax=Hydnomerulius pinastri MD-312 TaxID=994086 RepID=A0A0C9WA63_9AGAM|nr:hypothetical protein HYDPIDRAFT_32421 [Hydnomerulius pinastri MD-312]
MMMRTNIERALNDLIVSEKDITIANALPAYLRVAGFSEVSHDSLTSFEHAMDKYPMPPSKSRVISEKKILELMTEYWSDKLGVMRAFVCPCSGCGTRVAVDPITLEQLQHPERTQKRRLKSKKTRRVRAKRDIVAATPSDPLAPSTSAVML